MEEPQIHKAKKASRKMFYTVWLALAVIAAAATLFLSWSFESESILQIKNAPFPVRFLNNQDGGVVVLTTEYCKFKPTPGTVRVSFVSKSREVFLPIAPEKSPKGCETKELPILLPKDLPEDRYKVKFHAVYDLNPLKQNIPVDFESVEFDVTAANVVPVQ